MVLESYEVYTDGACSNNQGVGKQPGGWGVVFTDGRTYSGGTKETTNNRMELQAVIEALKVTPSGSQITIYSDSAYVINAFNQNWIRNWLRNGWKTSQGKPVENQDLWKALWPLVQDRTVNWVKVKGHSGNRWNEMADQLAVQGISKADIQQENTEILATEEPEPQIVISLSKTNYQLLLDKLVKMAEVDPVVNDLLNEVRK